MSDISLTTVEFKALSSESRTGILKMLQGRNYTLSELSAKTGMAAPTVKQHATILVGSGLIELRDEGRKWKYYALTRKGRQLLEAQRPQSANNILIILSSTIIVGLLGFAFLSSNFGVYSSAGVPQGIDIGSSGSIQAAPMQTGNELKSSADSTQTQNADTGQNCVPIFEVQYNTAPNLGQTASEFYAQKCFEQSGDRAGCENVDVYSERTHTFGEEDGKADCAWFEAQ